jgi:hypothetical protein
VANANRATWVMARSEYDRGLGLEAHQHQSGPVVTPNKA